MAVVRFSRDKRGYEHVYLVEPASRKGRAPRARILYWFRTPPGVKVGRQAFDDEIRRQLEVQNPGVTFDWKKIESASIPPPDAEPWRERRRLDRAAKQSRDSDVTDEVVSPPEDETEPSLEPAEASTPSPQATSASESSQPKNPRRRGRRRRRSSAASPQGPAANPGQDET